MKPELDRRRWFSRKRSTITAAGRSGAAEPRSRSRFPGEELALLLIATLLLVLPGLRCEKAASPVLSRFPAAPLRINVYRAPWYEWALLEGIGEARGRRIVEYRERHGPLRSPADLERIPGLPSGWLEKARVHLYFPERPGEAGIGHSSR